MIEVRPFSKPSGDEHADSGSRPTRSAGDSVTYFGADEFSQPEEGVTLDVKAYLERIDYHGSLIPTSEKESTLASTR